MIVPIAAARWTRIERGSVAVGVGVVAAVVAAVLVAVAGAAAVGAAAAAVAAGSVFVRNDFWIQMNNWSRP